MTFIVRLENDNDASFMQNIRRRGPLDFRKPAYIVEDLSLGLLVVAMGGKGDLPASSGEPPDYYSVRDKNNNISLYGLRYVGCEKKTDGFEKITYRVEFLLSPGCEDINVVEKAVLTHTNNMYERLGGISRISEVKIID